MVLRNGKIWFDSVCKPIAAVIGFKVAEIAQLFVTSPSTVERRLAEFGLSIRTTYAHLSESDLDATVTEIMREVPKVGCKRMTGLLLGRGLRVQ